MSGAGLSRGSGRARAASLSGLWTARGSRCHVPPLRVSSISLSLKCERPSRRGAPCGAQTGLGHGGGPGGAHTEVSGRGARGVALGSPGSLVVEREDQVVTPH